MPQKPFLAPALASVLEETPAPARLLRINCRTCRALSASPPETLGLAWEPCQAGEMGYEERSLGHNWRGGEVPLAIIPLTQPGRCQLVQLLHHMKTKSDTGNGDFILLF